MELQPLVLAVVLTHWRMELDKPGDLSPTRCLRSTPPSAASTTSSASNPTTPTSCGSSRSCPRTRTFKTYPLCTHLTNSWLGGNLRLANQLSQSERELGPETRCASYYHQQLDWQAGVVNLMNHVSFRTKSDRAGLVSLTGREIEKLLGLDGVAIHQMHRLLRFDSHLFPSAR